METEEIKVYVSGGYWGAGEVGAYINGKRHIIDIEYIKAYILKQMEERGYAVSKTGRQKFPRVVIN